MTRVRDLDGWPAGALHLAIGVFDGVHIGHRALIADLVRGARRVAATAVAATFDPLPEVALGRPAAGSILSTVDERAALLRDAGADAVVVFRFDEEFAAQSAASFLERLCLGREIRGVVVGPDFRFGRGREGDVAMLRAYGLRGGFTVNTVEPVGLDGEVVSSTRVRDALRTGDLTLAERMLARPYSVRGTVQRGAQRGRTLGYPTINVSTSPDKLLPADGIYACWVDVNGQRHRAATSLGVRPTFGEGARALECHLLDFSDDLYGATVAVTFARRLRDELRFPEARSLIEQIARDVEETRNALR
ncbi:MAG: bifunctional riboflavin kinase/FAD synthetase [Candidatus Limnocylindria bacterium]